jgi:hypothetical protein
MGEIRQRRDIADVEHWIRRRLDPDEARLARQRGARLVRIRHVDEGVAHAHRAADVAQLLRRAVIDLDRSDHVIARPQQAEDRKRRG